MYGRADRVKVFPDRIEALDFKNVKDGRVYLGNQFQALSYASMLEDALGLDLPTHGVILDWTSGEEAWRERLKKKRDDLLSCIDRIRAVLLGEKRPEPTGNENKCRARPAERVRSVSGIETPFLVCMWRNMYYAGT